MSWCRLGTTFNCVPSLVDAVCGCDVSAQLCSTTRAGGTLYAGVGARQDTRRILMHGGFLPGWICLGAIVLDLALETATAGRCVVEAANVPAQRRRKRRR